MTTPTTPSQDQLSARVRGLTDSVTLAITARAKALRAEGADVIGFGAGEPDFPTPPHVVEAAQHAATDPVAHKYTPAAGIPDLRAAIAEDTSANGGRPTRADEVIVTNGGKHALHNALQALLDPGDEALLPAPYWVTYPELVQLAGADVVELPTTAESGYRVSVDQLERARTPRTKLLIFTSPSNPTGAVYPPEEVEAIGRWAAETGVWVVADEIYQHLVYGEARHVSMPAVVPELADRCVLTDGVAKTFAMTGWRVGWAVGPQHVIAAMTRFQSHTTANVSNVAQYAATAALRGPRGIIDEMRATYDRRRHLAHDRLSAIAGVRCPLPEGAFYVFPSIEGLLGREYGGQRIDSAIDLCKYLLDTAQVALVPGEAFGSPGHLRLSYALGDEDLERGLARMSATLS